MIENSAPPMTEGTPHPQWMDDPSVTHIPKEKLAFLSELMNGTKNLSKTEMMQYLPRLAREAKEQKIQFSREEMNTIIAAVRTYSTDSEKQTIDKMLSSHQL